MSTGIEEYFAPVPKGAVTRSRLPKRARSMAQDVFGSSSDEEPPSKAPIECEEEELSSSGDDAPGPASGKRRGAARRTNWSLGEAGSRMSEAVDGWDNQTGKYEEGMAMKA